MEYRLQDLYEMISLVAPGLLGTPSQFRGVDVDIYIDRAQVTPAVSNLTHV